MILFPQRVPNPTVAPEHHELTSTAAKVVTVDLRSHLPQGELAKLYRGIETALPDVSNRIIQFVSAYDHEGAGHIAFETAVIASQLMGKRVLFVDTSNSLADTQSQQSMNRSGTSLDVVLITGRQPYEAITQAAGTDLYFVKLRQHNEDNVLRTPLSVIETAFHYFRHNFDLIIINSQGIMKDALGISLAKLADGSILVVEAERTRAPVALESKRLVEAGGGTVIGSVLNRRRFYIPKFLYRLLYQHPES